MDETKNKLFVSECPNVNMEVRIKAMVKNLPKVAKALGTERTKTKLIPCLQTLTEGTYNNNEVLISLADQLGSFLPFVGGAENAHLVLNVLEKLAAVEEKVVRGKAIESLYNIASVMNAATLENVFIPLVLRLADSKGLASKCSATALFAKCYSKVSEDTKATLRKAYESLCQDESPLVRQSAAENLTEFIKVLELNHLKDKFIPVFNRFSKDDQDSVRVLAVGIVASIAGRLEAKDVEDLILPGLTGLCGDTSSKVREQVACEINTIQAVIGNELTKKYLMPMYQSLASDKESQVRKATANAIGVFYKILQQTYNNKLVIGPVLMMILPLIEYLDVDVDQEVKDTLSMIINSLSLLLGAEKLANLLFPLITNVISNKSSVAKIATLENLKTIILLAGISNGIFDGIDAMLKTITDTEISNTVLETATDTGISDTADAVVETVIDPGISDTVETVADMGIPDTVTSSLETITDTEIFDAVNRVFEAVTNTGISDTVNNVLEAVIDTDVSDTLNEVFETVIDPDISDAVTSVLETVSDTEISDTVNSLLDTLTDTEILETVSNGLETVSDSLISNVVSTVLETVVDLISNFW